MSMNVETYTHGPGTEPAGNASYYLGEDALEEHPFDDVNTCPIYIMNGKLDRIVPAADTQRLAREVKGPVVLNLVEDGNHIANNRAYRWRSQSADWLAEQLA